MEQKHTKEPWITTKAGPVMAGYSQGDAIVSLDMNTIIAGCFSDVRGGPEVAEANARRIVACVNACAGISTESLEQYQKGSDSFLTVLNNLERDRSALLEKLTEFVWLEKSGYVGTEFKKAMYQLIEESEQLIASLSPAPMQIREEV